MLKLFIKCYTENYFHFRDRASRKEYISFFLFYGMICLIYEVLTLTFGFSLELEFLFFIMKKPAAKKATAKGSSSEKPAAKKPSTLKPEKSKTVKKSSNPRDFDDDEDFIDDENIGFDSFDDLYDEDEDDFQNPIIIELKVNCK